MKPADPQPPSDADLDRLLASRLKRTSPEFELRWRELRARLVAAPPTRRRSWIRWLLWPGLATAALAAAALVLTLRHASPDPVALRHATFENLIALDAALAPAAPLFDPENREAVLHLPAKTQL